MTSIVEHPDPRLRQPCREVTSSDRGSLRAFVDRMLDVMYTHQGVGLAAPQIGWNVRVIVVDPSNGENDRACRVMINPVLCFASVETETCPEGCLSLPGEFYNVPRSTSVLARWEDLDGVKHESRLTGVEARIFLHEIDHLDCVMIGDIGTRATFRDREDL